MTRAQIAQLLGCSIRNFDERVRPRMSKSAIKGKASKLRIDCRAAVAAQLAQQVELAQPAIDEDDPLMTGNETKSKALELYRHEKYVEQKRKNDEAAKRICDLASLSMAFEEGAAAMREGGEVLKRRWGPEALDVHLQSIDRFVAASRRVLRGPP